MPDPALLLARLDAIGSSLAGSGHALALIGLGSVGRDTARLDRYSDLDFFVIVEPGHKAAYLDSLAWLEAAGTLGYRYRNTVDGWKALYADGVLCEFAVFEPGELERIPYAAGRVVWRRADAPAGLETPRLPLPAPPVHDVEWLVGEALTGLYAGLCRHARGERLAGLKLIEQAADRVVELAARGAAVDAARDPFAVERRLEARLPALAAWLPRFHQGYAQVPQSALALLEYLEAHHAVATIMSALLRDLIASAPSTADTRA